ncbi:hypothetical protein [Verminephrobacter eiseniae]|uniref:hypothetical protein n=1 Tax=Verminephrobacter eiseniae TaxID=364317 RepID=UPI002238A8D9|nr:hypothetical protein [Verminephrobacter eiseniae]
MKTMLRPSRWAFFERRPAMPLAPNNLRLVALACYDASPDSQVELRRGAIAMTINWPTSAAAEFAAWTEGAGEHTFLAARIERWLCGNDGCPRSWSPRCPSTRWRPS